MAVRAEQWVVIVFLNLMESMHRSFYYTWIYLQVDELTRRQRHLAAQQAVTELALGIGRVERIVSVACTTTLFVVHVSDQLLVYSFQSWIVKAFMTGETTNAGINHCLHRLYVVTAMAVCADRQILVRFGVQVARIVTLARKMALLAVLRNIRRKLCDGLSRVWLMWKSIPLTRTVAIGAGQVCTAMLAMYRTI
jgi:hypothetical protein